MEDAAAARARLAAVSLSDETPGRAWGENIPGRQELEAFAAGGRSARESLTSGAERRRGQGGDRKERRIKGAARGQLLQRPALREGMVEGAMVSGWQGQGVAGVVGEVAMWEEAGGGLRSRKRTTGGTEPPSQGRLMAHRDLE